MSGTKNIGGASKPKRQPKETDETKPCIVCHEAIRRGARLCIHCESAQDWTRHILRWTGVWTAVLALLPLWSGALALLEIAFPNHKAEVKFQPISCTKDAVILAVTNTGDRPGIISKSVLTMWVGNQITEAKFDLMPATKQRVVRPGQTFTLQLGPQVEGTSSTLPSGRSKSCEYRIETQVDAFDLGSYPVTVKCPCPGSTT